MHLKKMLTLSMATAFVSALLVMPVSAHGHHRRYTQKLDTYYPICTIEECTEEGRHVHDGYNYCGYAHADGYCDGSCIYNTNVSNCGSHHCH